MKTYYDSDADLSLLSGKKIAIIGYGSQGRAQTLNLRDRGKDMRVGLKLKLKSFAKAQQATRNYAKRQLTWFRNQLTG